MRRLLPLLIALLGLAGGVGAGLALAPPDAPTGADAHTGEAGPAGAGTGEDGIESADKSDGGSPEENAGSREFVELNNQFVVPVVGESEVSSLVVLSLSLAVPSGRSPEIYSKEPRLRDAFLQVLFDHANSGGFDGAFTATTRMRALRTALLETAQQLLGRTVQAVLITDIMRQDA